MGFAASLAALVVLAVAGRVPFDAYPRLEVPLDARVLVVTLAAAVLALLPFADRRGIG